MKKANEIRYIVTDVVSVPVVRYIYKGDAYAQATKPGYGTVEWYSAEDGYQNPVDRDRNDKTQVLCCDEDCDAVLYPKFGPEFVISPYEEINAKEIPKQAAVEAILIGDADEWISWTKDGKIKIFVTYDKNGLIDNYRFGFKDKQPYADETEIAFEDLYKPDNDDYGDAYRADIPGTLEYQSKTEHQEAGQTASAPGTDETTSVTADTGSSLTEEEIKYFEDTVAKVKRSVNVRVPIEIMDHEQLTGKHKEALGICWAKYDSAGNRVPYRMTIDEFFVHECFVALEKPYMKLEPESLEQVIAHEIAHLHCWRHGKKHTELTRRICRLIEKGEPHGMGDGDTPVVSETGHARLINFPSNYNPVIVQKLL